MGDHLALIVDRLLTESKLEAAIGSGKHMVDLRQEIVDVEYCHRGLMGDHLALIVDRLLTESTLEAAIGSGKHMVDLRQEIVDVEYCHRG
ncbi:hypothetical protein ZEAMMB73_Zm00001d042896 [Zea mays]|uniref:Uncharacterized protein n=1 Tax=Zea mays TaxID=4577 RepID=A0A1D6N7D0_MAIZE|nr:hypothetical protein ZEAMMB73_Zm00001d042896 [Zea mays]